MAVPVSAQQQTTESLSNTRNPQSGEFNPEQQQSNLQQPTGLNELNSARGISVPEGRPAPPESTARKRGNGLSVATIVILLSVGVLAFVVVLAIFGSRQPALDQTEAAAADPKADAPEKPKKSSKKHASSASQTKKKKRRSKSKKK